MKRFFLLVVFMLAVPIYAQAQKLVTGQVLMSNGKPAKDVLIYLVIDNKNTYDPLEEDSWAETDQNGKFKIFVPDDNPNVLLSLNQFDPGEPFDTKLFSNNFQHQYSGEKNLIIKFPSPGKLNVSGKANFSKDSEFAYVEIVSMNRKIGKAVETDKAGNYKIEGLITGFYRMAFVSNAGESAVVYVNLENKSRAINVRLSPYQELVKPEIEYKLVVFKIIDHLRNYIELGEVTIFIDGNFYDSRFIHKIIQEDTLIRMPIPTADVSVEELVKRVTFVANELDLREPMGGMKMAIKNSSLLPILMHGIEYADKHEIYFMLSPGGPLKLNGRVTTFWGTKKSKVSIELRDKDKPFVILRRTFTDEHGNYSISGLNAGEYVVYAKRGVQEFPQQFLRLEENTVLNMTLKYKSTKSR